MRLFKWDINLSFWRSKKGTVEPSSGSAGKIEQKSEPETVTVAGRTVPKAKVVLSDGYGAAQTGDGPTAGTGHALSGGAAAAGLTSQKTGAALYDLMASTDGAVNKQDKVVEPPKVEAKPVFTAPPKVETPKPEAAKVEAPKVEPPKVEPPKVEPPKVETKPVFTAPKPPETPKPVFTAPKPPETPKPAFTTPKPPETPKPAFSTAKPAEPPKAEVKPSFTAPPKIETPKIETPKIETPKEAPKPAAAAKVETPKADPKAPGSVIAELAKRPTEAKFKTVDMVTQPTSRTASSVTYKFGGYEGAKLLPGEQILAEIPADLRGRPVCLAILEHRQISSDKSIKFDPSTERWDGKPGITALHFHSPKSPEGQDWRYWKAPWGSSGDDGGKYAELRSDWEQEMHFEFMKNGHAPVKGSGGYGGVSHEELPIDAIRIRGVGQDPTRVARVVVQFLPPRPDQTDEAIFSPGTKIGDPYTAAGRAYGKTHDGQYPEALQLGGYGSAGGAGAAKLPAGWKLVNGNLEIDLKPGLKFTCVEISCGDTHPDKVPNKDGGIGTLGWSRLFMGVKRAGSGSTEWFAEEIGVPPNGVMLGMPKQELAGKPGDKLVISARNDTTYVMGARVWYSNDKPAES